MNSERTTRLVSGSKAGWAFGPVWALGLIASAALVCVNAQGQTPVAPVPDQKPSAAIPADAATPGLPATPATGAAGATTDQATPAAYSRADVHFVEGKLTVDATNVSLNQILREISHKTGIKLTGGVTDERVYGHYGPATPSEVLSSLLDGTESNMLLVANTNGPSELILTPRLGGPTPPNPNASAGDSDDVPRQDAQGFGIRRSIGMRRGAENAPPSDQGGASPSTGIAPPSNPDAIPNAGAAGVTGAAGSTDQPDQAPNGTKTPQQIYEQLRQLQLQQAQQSQAPQ